MDHPIVVEARALAATLSTHTDAHAGDRQLAPAVVDALRAGPYLRLLLPATLGGAAVDAPTYVDVLAALAAGDAATAWVVMTASTSTLLAGYLDEPYARAVWGAGPAPLLAGVFAPGGRVVDGRLTGRWPYASGCRHADWLAVGALRGEPAEHVVCVVPMATPGVRVIDTWDPIGLAGTGSHDVVLDDVALPAGAIGSVFARPPWLAEPLARVPLFGLLATGVAAVGVGIAAAALAATAARLTGGKEPAPAGALARHAELHARHAAAAAALRDVAGRAHAAAAAGAVDDATRGALRATAAHVAATCGEVGRGAFHLVGGAAIGRRSPWARAVADLDVLATHRMVADRVLPAAGRALLGLGASREL